MCPHGEIRSLADQDWELYTKTLAAGNCRRLEDDRVDGERGEMVATFSARSLLCDRSGK
jgi:hypothetical protein